MKKLYIIGMGPGAYEQMTLEAIYALKSCDVIAGYTVYIDLIKDYFSEKEFLSTPMRQEEQRCLLALESANNGKTTAMLCSGDAGVYGMAGLVYELHAAFPEVELKVIPGVTAALSGAAVLGAPLMHDFSVISLSDLMTPWSTIEKRLHAAGQADFVICLYNPSSKKRTNHLKKACEILLNYRKEDTICGVIKNISRNGESKKIMLLRDLKNFETDMFTTVFIGNSETKELEGIILTPRGYQKKGKI